MELDRRGSRPIFATADQTDEVGELDPTLTLDVACPHSLIVLGGERYEVQTVRRDADNRVEHIVVDDSP